MDESLRRGIESYVAELLRRHVVDSVFAADAVTRGLSPEAVKRLRADVEARLAEAEAAGLADRVVVKTLIESALGGSSALAAAVASVCREVLDRVAASAKGQGG